MNRYLNLIIKISIISYLIFTALVFYGQKRTAQINLSTTQISPTIQQQVESTPTAQKKPKVVTSTPAPDLFAELPKHNTRTDCWIMYEGHLYDITSYFGSHPGGDQVMIKYCGQDVTTGFNTKDKSSPKPHSSSAKDLLQQYLIK